MNYIDPEVVQHRMEARSTAEEIMQYALELCPEHESDCYWREIQKKIVRHAPDSAYFVTCMEDARPMDEAEVKAFEKEEIPFGCHSGREVGELMKMHDGPSYLVWISGLRFIDNVRRYLRNLDVSRRVGEL